MLQNISLNESQQFSENSKVYSAEIGKKYRVSFEYIGKEGSKFCAYFGVVQLDQGGIEIDRKIQWLNDFSNSNNKTEIVFSPNTEKFLIIYRINQETALTSKCEYEILPLKKIIISEATESELENFSRVYDYSLPLQILSENNEEILESNLIWTIGMPRSGTTWLGTQLLSYGTQILDESQLGIHLGTLQRGSENNLVRDFDYFSNSGNYFFGKMYKNTWIYFLRKLILNRLYSQFPNISKKIVIKEPSASTVPDILLDCFPKSKMILILRDGRDVVDSNVDAFQKNTWRTKSNQINKVITNRTAFIKQISKSWVTRTEIIINTNRQYSQNSYLIQYENLRSNTLEEMKKIYKFLEIEITDEKLREIVDKSSFEKIPKEQKGSGKFARSATPGKWKEHFSEKEQKIMTEIMGDTLKKLGY